jgi:hypothetical protein
MPPIRPDLAEQADGTLNLAERHRTTIDLAILLRVAQQREGEIESLRPIRRVDLFRRHVVTRAKLPAE